MKSSDAVFTNQNPFPPEPFLPKAHYSPSQAKRISKQQKKLVLSPVRFDQRSSSSEPPPSHTSVSLEDQRFLEGSYRVVLCSPPSVKETFSESWPSTDQGASRASAGVSRRTEFHASQQQQTAATQDSSVLAKYIERFRYGRPQSREERQMLGAGEVDGRSFWWKASPPQQTFSFTSPQSSKEHFRGSLDHRNDGIDIMRSLAEQSQPDRGLPDLSVLALSDSSLCEPGEPEILQLQERASRLLQKRVQKAVSSESENSVNNGSSSGPPVSSEGLGSSDFSSPVSTDEPVRRPTLPSLMDSANLLTAPNMFGGGLLHGHSASALGSRGLHARPEDDILFQWRLRRKMEQARQWSQTSSNTSAFQQPFLSRLTQQHSPVLADPPRKAGINFTPTPSVGTDIINTSSACPVLLPAHPVSNATFCKPQPKTSVQTPEDFNACSHPDPFSRPARKTTLLESKGPCSLPQTHFIIQDNPSESSVETYSKPHTFSSPSPQSSESTVEDWQTQQLRGDRPRLERPGKKATTSSRKKKFEKFVGRADGVERNQHLAKVNGRVRAEVSCKTKESSQESGLQNGVQNSTREVRAGDCAPPPSPIHNTLGQVVSEVLFPGADSPKPPGTPCSSDTPRNTPLAPPQSPAAPSQSPAAPLGNLLQPSEVIDQLMQDAQDSDELEFEDDPLLLVLRQQRKWVKEQLCEVDEMLEELHKD
ncbi:proline and serine-rich protein 3 isoform X2 [Hoplias malabaricus]|uniref:proline and serine-rich protein 3 isoform X2 n=1 Tax=Hoplias malabaricus TaxID=27720 RepID=UPI003461B53C